MHIEKDYVMPETKDLKSRLHEVGTALKNLFKPEQSKTDQSKPEQSKPDQSKPEHPKKALDQATVETELAEFVKINGYDASDPNFDIEKFQNEFIAFLKAKNYDFAGVEASLVPGDFAENTGRATLQALRNVRKVTEDLNDLPQELSVFADTTKMMPGLVCYVIGKIAPTAKKPYVTYRPVPRVITQVHDSGVNGGTIFFTYNHKISTLQNFNGVSYVVSEDEVIYSPLTKEHADYICKLLNIQSKQVYTKYLKEMKKLTLQAQRMIPRSR